MSGSGQTDSKSVRVEGSNGSGGGGGGANGLVLRANSPMNTFVESCLNTVAGSAVAVERRTRHRPRAARLLKVLAGKKNILVTTHQHPDPDAIGSSHALAHLLKVKLKDASVLLIGAGGLGSPLALYLAAAGVGRIGIVDFDVVDESNLQRQLLHGTSDVGRPKLESARARLREVNPLIRIETHEARLTSENALELFRAYDIVADGTDNFPTRYLVNDACVLTGKPNVYGSIFRFEGQASVFATVEGPCYRCLYPEPPPAGLVPSCAEGGVLGVLPGIVVLKLILGEGTPLVGRLLLFDALAMSFRTLKLRRDPSCPVCGPNATIRKLIDYEAFCGIEAEIGPGTGEFELTPSELKKKIDRGEDLVLLDVREPQEWDISRIENARLIPLGRLPYALGELSTADEIVAFCRSGVRSRKALQLLREAGFRKVHNLSGGINAWAEKVDASVPRY